jgi:CheY-like chemotaxis protein
MSLTGGLLRVLLVEDSEDDAMLALRELKRAGHTVVFERVETEDGLRRALQKAPWDVVLCDGSMPSFSAGAAMRTLATLESTVPLILVSGTLDEKGTAEAVRAGASAVVLKSNLAGLSQAVARVLSSAARARTNRTP